MLKLLVMLASLSGLVNAQITATLGKSVVTAPLSLRPSITISSFTCDPQIIDPGEVSVCTITLSEPARKGGVKLSFSCPSWAGCPSTMSANEGTQIITFRVTTLADISTTSPPVQLSPQAQPAVVKEEKTEGYVLTASSPSLRQFDLPDDYDSSTPIKVHRNGLRMHHDLDYVVADGLLEFTKQQTNIGDVILVDYTAKSNK